MHPLTDCIRLTDIAPAKCQQTRYRSEFTAASRGFPATAWLSCFGAAAAAANHNELNEVANVCEVGSSDASINRTTHELHIARHYAFTISDGVIM